MITPISFLFPVAPSSSRLPVLNMSKKRTKEKNGKKKHDDVMSDVCVVFEKIEDSKNVSHHFNHSHSSNMSQYTSSFLLLLLITVCLSISEVSCSSSPSGQVPSAHKLDQRLKDRNSSDHGNMIPQQGRPKRRFVFQGPILTLTLKDPFADERSEPTMATSSSSSTSDQRDEALSAGSQDEQNDTTVPSSAAASIRSRLFWPRKYNPASYSSFLNLKSLAPTLLYSIRSTTKPFPNYFPSLQSSSVTAGYKYDDVKNKPSFIEGELSFRKTFGSIDGTGSTRNMALEVDIGPSYLVKEQKGVLVVRIGGDGVDNETSGFGCSALARFVMNKGKRVRI